MSTEPFTSERVTTASETVTSLRTVPEEPGWPVVGALPSMLRDAPGFLAAAARRHPGELFAVRLGPMSVPIVTQPAHVQHVLVDRARDFTKGGMWGATRPLLGNGLVTSEGDFWLRQRRLMQPLFGQKHLATLADRMVDAAEREVARIARGVGAGAPVEMGDEMTQVTQRVLLETMFGTSLDVDAARPLGRHLITAFETMNTRIFLYFVPGWVPLPGDRAFRRSVRFIDEALLAMVRRRRAEPGAGDDLLARLLGARDADTGETMSDAQVRDELVTLFVAGLDTTAVTLTWLWYLLDAHPDVDARMRAEIAAVVGDRRPAVEDLARLVYTKQVIQEAMRLYPPAWMFPRFAAEDTAVGGCRIPAGTSMLLVPFLTHRDPALWERPETFDPDRFAPERAAGRHRYAYFPFGGGGRQCIGNHFAMMEAQIIVTLMAQRLRPRLAPGHAVTPASSSTLKPRGGLPMTLSRV